MEMQMMPFLMKNASSVIIVPGYELAVAKQHIERDGRCFKKMGVKISYAIHPVLRKNPGHMNVLLAEANVPYDEVFELEINNDFSNCDVPT